MNLWMYQYGCKWIWGLFLMIGPEGSWKSYSSRRISTFISSSLTLSSRLNLPCCCLRCYHLFQTWYLNVLRLDLLMDSLPPHSKITPSSSFLREQCLKWIFSFYCLENHRLFSSWDFGKPWDACQTNSTYQIFYFCEYCWAFFVIGLTNIHLARYSRHYSNEIFALKE